MSKVVLGFWNRIKAFLACFVSGIIFLVSGITNIPIFGQRYLEFIQNYFTGLDPISQVIIANILAIMILISDFVGCIIFISSFLILFNRIRIAKLILFIVMGVGIFAFVVPIFTALINGIAQLSIAIDSVSTKYAVAVLFALLAKLYADKSKN